MERNLHPCIHKMYCLNFKTLILYKQNQIFPNQLTHFQISIWNAAVNKTFKYNTRYAHFLNMHKSNLVATSV